MRFLKELRIGASAFGEAHRLIIKQKMWKYLLLPGLFHLVLLIIVSIIAWQVSGNITDQVIEWLNLEAANEKVKWLKATARFMILFTIRIMVILLYLSVYKYIVLFVMAPIFAYVSEMTEEKLTGKSYPFKWKQFIKDALRGMMVALRNLLIEGVWLVFLYIFAFIPVIGLLSAVMIFTIQSYFFGFSMIDYYHERHKYSIKEGVSYMRKHKGLAIGIGAIFHFMLLIPIIGWIVAPIYASIAGTVAAHKLDLENTDVTQI